MKRMEREKVIKGLNDIGGFIAGRIGFEQARNFLRTIDDAIKLLKEQEAVEPTLIREGRNKNYNDYVCPRCDNEVVYEQNYCSECGVEFLWKGR